MPLFVRHKKPGPLRPTANPYPSRIQRWRQNLGVLPLLLLLLGGGALRFYKPFYDVFQQRLFEGTAWIQGVFIRPFQTTHAFLGANHTFVQLKEDHTRLKEENDALRRQLHVLHPLIHENAVLKQSLNVSAFEQYKPLMVRILSSPYDGLHHFFLIAAGDKKGLVKDQAVVVPEGVLGRLEKIGHYVSRVLLLNDSNSRIPVMTFSSEQKAILAGDGSFLPTLVYVEDSRKIQKGERVVTSGLGGIFPAGLPVGVVEDITNGKVRVRPYAPFRKLEWVHVLCLHSQEALQEIKMGLEGE